MLLKTALLLLVAAAFAATDARSADTPPPAAPTAPPAVTLPAQRVTGIGGFFFRAAKPGALARWYKSKLGVERIPMEIGQKPWTQEGGPTAFAPFPKDTDYFAKDKGWMINFRVNDLDAIVAQLRAAGEEVTVDPTTYPNGRFAHLHDPEGNPIELWQEIRKS